MFTRETSIKNSDPPGTVKNPGEHLINPKVSEAMEETSLTQRFNERLWKLIDTVMKHN